MRVDRPTLIYDGECGFCRRSVDWVRRRDREHRLVLLPFQDEDRVARLGIPLPALAAAMHLVRPDGRVPAWLFRVPGVLPVARRVYGWIARQRRCLVRGYPAD